MYEQLNQYTDEELLALIVQAKEILDTRDKEYKQETMRKIRQLAGDAGLSVQIKSKRKYKKRNNTDKGGTDDRLDDQDTH